MDGDGVINRDALRGYIDRVASLHSERDELNEGIREVYKEAKDAGFDTTTLREIVREQRMEDDARHSRYALLDSYRAALGMLADTPLGEAATSAHTAARPKPFAEQPVARRGRGRPRKEHPAADPVDAAMDRARSHLGGDARAEDYRPH